MRMVSRHTHCSAYHAQFFPNGDSSVDVVCPCDEDSIQTIEHIIFDCPILAPTRPHFVKAQRTRDNWRNLFEENERMLELLTWLRRYGAFTPAFPTTARFIPLPLPPPSPPPGWQP